MAHRLFLHIGMMKSGTTYIQSVCNQNADALAAGGITWVGGSYRRQAAAVGEFRGSRRVMPGSEGSWRAVRREVRQLEGDALISFELIADMREKEIARFVGALAADEVHVLVTARDLSRVLPSLWQESTQNRGTERWPDYLAAACDEGVNPGLKRNIDLHTDYAAALRRWATVIPRERLHLITVPPASAGPDELWHRFASVIGAQRSLARPQRSNQTIGAVSAELMVRMNERVADVDWPVYRLGFKQGMSKRGVSGRAGAEPKVAFPQERWDWVEQRTREMVEEVRRIGPAVVGDLDDLLPTRSEGVPAGWQPSDAELLEAALDGLEAMGRQLGSARLAEWNATPAVEQPTPASRWRRQAARLARRARTIRRA